MASPPAKRRREGEPDSDAWARHPELWLEDGNIVLVCEDVGFCVTRSILSLNSPIFKDMFTVVDPTQGESYGGLPVVRLPDTADEIYHLLKAMHFRQHGRIKSQPKYRALAAILKMSTKYMVDGLREEMIDALTQIFPSSLGKEYDGRYIPDDFDDLDILHVVQLALQNNVPIILPSACYHTCHLSLERVVDSPDSISDATRRTCVLFRDAFVKIVCKTLMKCNSSPENPWKARTKGGRWKCSANSCVGIQEEFKESIDDMFRFPDIHHADTFLSLTWTHGCICAACTKLIHEYWHRVQEKIWAGLPSLCGFQDWKDVSNAQDAASHKELEN